MRFNFLRIQIHNMSSFKRDTFTLATRTLKQRRKNTALNLIAYSPSLLMLTRLFRVECMELNASDTS